MGSLGSDVQKPFFSLLTKQKNKRWEHKKIIITYRK